ncbi:hypothetical protein SLS56_006820 [Neofusicoccum ribis]|uniref:Uncharacterized protein n=1 Tax=Neofusicoccum ribis TaxID=45134 RepID=A0ABR3SPM6_9PEZI
MATTRLRKAFRYPDDSDEEPPEGIDEEEQEKLITQIHEEDVAKTDFYKVPCIPLHEFQAWRHEKFHGAKAQTMRQTTDTSSP